MTDPTPPAPPAAPLDVEELRKLAENATPGPWWTAQNGAIFDIREVCVVRGENGDWSVNTVNKRASEQADASHIAAFNPTVALALLSELTRLTKIEEAARAVVEDTRHNNTTVQYSVKLLNALAAALTPDNQEEAR